MMSSNSLSNVIQQVKRMLTTADLDTVLSTVAKIPDFTLSLTNIMVGGMIIKEVRLLGVPMIVIDLGDIRVGFKRVVKGVTLADVVKALRGYKSIYNESKYQTCVSPPQYQYCTQIWRLPAGLTTVYTGRDIDVHVVKYDSRFSVDINSADGYFHINGISIYDDAGIYVRIFLKTVAQFMPSVRQARQL